jgi:hypothetical protein
VSLQLTGLQAQRSAYRLYDARRAVEYRLRDPEGRCWSSGGGAMFLCAGHIYFERSKDAT